MAAEIGSYGAGRLAAGGTVHEIGGGDLTVVAQSKVYDGPWRQPERLRHYSGFAKFERPTALGELELSGQGYRGKWRPTEQIPERLIGSSLCADAFCSPDQTATGQTTRLILNAKLSGEGWKGALYAQHYDWDMYSNPTYANADASSAQIHQFDRRQILGFRADRSWTLSDRLDVAIGTENRFDRIGKVGVVHTDRRVFIESYGLYRVHEGSASIYGEATLRPVEGLRITAGLRGDAYRAKVDAKDTEAAALGVGKAGDEIVSPKFGAAYKLSDHVEVYGNWGRGFHSNDARGAVYSTRSVPLLVKGVGEEIGARFQAAGASLTATYWRLGLDSELRFVGDSNAVEPSGASRRRGYELVAFWRPLAWLALDASYTASRSRYDNGDHIPNAFENAAQAGVSVIRGDWEGSLRVRHLGPSPLVEDNSVRDKGSTVVNARGAYKFPAVNIYAEVLNIADSKDKDIAYAYESFIPGFDAAPVEGRLSRVVEPRTVRVGIKSLF